MHRIGAPADRGAGLSRLGALVRAHLESVPFETLDIWRKSPLSLERGALFDKIVRRRRGGFCYELNGLFAWLLGELGYEVELRSARVISSSGRLGPPFDHLTLVVRGEDFTPHLVDVGFGEGPRGPLPAEPGSVVEDLGLTWVLEDAGDELRLRLAAGQGPVEVGTGYLIDPVPRALDEFDGMREFHERSPDSAFVARGLLCTLATRRGRITLARHTLRRWIAGAPPRHEAVPDSQLEAVLAGTFGIELGD